MKKNISLDLLVLLFGVLLVVLIKEPARFIGAGFISLGATYFFIDRICDIKENKKIKNK